MICDLAGIALKEPHVERLRKLHFAGNESGFNFGEQMPVPALLSGGQFVYIRFQF
ncbi:hypothetical protein SDC9_208861 [bioreactor metagenome]|uniref:Uncharacterized protein n=1 Tax=bioreactor metagenome TaxID=1076179 RepID=A0A645JCS1_9ZZZZ